MNSPALKVNLLMFRFARRLALLGLAAAAALPFLFLTGCETASTPSPALLANSIPPPQTLQAGDVIHIAFPGATDMETTQQIRRDGKLNLGLIGEVVAAGQTPMHLENELKQRYASQLRYTEVKITIVSSSFSVFVTGAVSRPGKIQPDHALTAFEAIMEAGGFDNEKANAAAVKVIRTQGSKTQTFILNLQSTLDGKPNQPFYLQSNDTVFVPEKFQWF